MHNRRGKARHAPIIGLKRGIGPCCRMNRITSTVSQGPVHLIPVHILKLPDGLDEPTDKRPGRFLNALRLRLSWARHVQHNVLLAETLEPVHGPLTLRFKSVAVDLALHPFRARRQSPPHTLSITRQAQAATKARQIARLLPTYCHNTEGLQRQPAAKSGRRTANHYLNGRRRTSQDVS